jgi:hypothetical protein
VNRSCIFNRPFLTCLPKPNMIKKFTPCLGGIF